MLGCRYLGRCRRTPPRSRTDSPPDVFVLTWWTADPEVARRADRAGIDRVGVDLERLGKVERQRGCRTWISPHTERDLGVVGQALRSARLFARVNPINDDSAREVESVLDAGARVLMLPMAATPNEVGRFVSLVAARALVVLLVERREALERLPDLVAVDGVDEVHIGLNDLALSLGMPNRWALVASDLVAEAGACVRAAGLPFGFGGIGRAHDDTLPIPSDLVYAEYARVGATRALVSRSFGVPGGRMLAWQVERARRRLAEWQAATPGEFAAAHAELGRRVARVRGW